MTSAALTSCPFTTGTLSWGRRSWANRRGLCSSLTLTRRRRVTSGRMKLCLMTLVESLSCQARLESSRGSTIPQSRTARSRESGEKNAHWQWQRQSKKQRPGLHWLRALGTLMSKGRVHRSLAKTCRSTSLRNKLTKSPRNLSRTRSRLDSQKNSFNPKTWWKIKIIRTLKI